MSVLETSIRLRISQRDRERLQVVADKRGIRPSVVIREGVLAFLDSEEHRLSSRKKVKR